MDQHTSIQELKNAITKFRDERDWKKHHNPKDLAISISLQANELLEIFQWKKEIQNLSPSDSEHLKEEIADVVIYCLSMCDVLGIDLSDAIKDKILKNGKKYPIK